jgi:hypothetical protein
MGALAAGFLFLLGADWSGALVRPGLSKKKGGSKVLDEYYNTYLRK